MTGWSRTQIDYGIRKWRLGMFTETYWNAVNLGKLLDGLAKQIELPFSDPQDNREALAKAIRGSATWEFIDRIAALRDGLAGRA